MTEKDMDVIATALDRARAKLREAQSTLEHAKLQHATATARHLALLDLACRLGLGDDGRPRTVIPPPGTPT